MAAAVASEFGPELWTLGRIAIYYIINFHSVGPTESEFKKGRTSYLVAESFQLHAGQKLYKTRLHGQRTCRGVRRTKHIRSVEKSLPGSTDDLVCRRKKKHCFMRSIFDRRRSERNATNNRSPFVYDRYDASINSSRPFFRGGVVVIIIYYRK